MSKDVLGHIDCPTCGKAHAMRITHDKNKEPFGYCEDGCLQQLRIGGKPARVRAFVARYPWAAAGATVTVTVPEPAAPAPAKPVTVPEQKPVPKPAPPATPPVPEPPPAPVPAKKASPWGPIIGRAA